jgi:hypothetical protein
MPRNSTLPLVDPADEDGVVVVTSQVPIPINPNHLACPFAGKSFRCAKTNGKPVMSKKNEEKGENFS